MSAQTIVCICGMFVARNQTSSTHSSSTEKGDAQLLYSRYLPYPQSSRVVACKKSTGWQLEREGDICTATNLAVWCVVFSMKQPPLAYINKLGLHHITAEDNVYHQTKCWKYSSIVTDLEWNINVCILLRIQGMVGLDTGLCGVSCMCTFTETYWMFMNH